MKSLLIKNKILELLNSLKGTNMMSKEARERITNDIMKIITTHTNEEGNNQKCRP